MAGVVAGEGKTLKDYPQTTEASANDLIMVESPTEGTRAMKFGEIAANVAEQMADTPEYVALNNQAQQAINSANEAVQTANTAVENLQQYDTRLGDVEDAQDTLTTAMGNKQNKATDPKELGAGYLYQQSDGSVVLTEANPKFKYTIIVDNGTDGTVTAVEYADDAVGITPASGPNLGGWGETELLKEYFRPCVIKRGTDSPAYFLNPTNLKKKLDDTASVLTGADGDVMVQVKKMYGKISKVANGKVAISISNVREDGSWFCWNEVAGVEKEYRYRGRYMAGFATGDETMMRSISGVPKTVNKTRAAFRTLATAMGPQYCQNDIYMIFLWQFMYLLMYKNRNSQSALGQGRTLSSNTANVNTGWSDNYGCCFGDQGGVNGVVFLWVEDFYGDTWEWADGACYVNNIYKLTRDPSKYNDTGVGYEIELASGMTAANNNNKYITKLAMTNDVPFLPVGSGGSSATFWCDNVWVADATQVVRFGGHWADAARAGAFCWDLLNPASFAHSYVGSRLCRN